MTAIFTKEQCEILEFARSGHNILITGQAGTGKSTIVNAIREDCKQRGLKVALVCSSGIACHVYERGIASTAHSYYALGAADMPSEKLILRAISDVRITEKLRKVDVVIWDEASMSSARMLELANALHHRAYECDGEESKMPFAETQLIVVGEFLQLRPVPNNFDSGDFMFTSIVFQHAVPHRFQLTKVLRQSEENAFLLHALSEVRLGICSEETAQYIKHLSRNIQPELEAIATHIFFKKNSVLLFNRSRLEDVDGEFIRFDATYEGSAGDKISCPGEKVLHLKNNCKVMLVWNLSDELKNGSMGTFKKAVDEKLLVNFEKVGTIAIERVTWVRRNRQGEKIGSFTQFPVILAYAVTCHKSQGLELPGVVLHSSKEFVPGLIYVAMSRVKSQDTLQVLDFNQNQLQAADPEVIRQCSRNIGECDQSLNCCRRKSAVDGDFFDVRDRFDAEDSRDATEDCYQFPIDVCDGLVQAYFESDDTEVDLNVAELFYQMENRQSELSRPPQEGFDVRAVLNALKVHTPGSEYSQMVNEALDCLKEPHLSENLKAFVDVVWFHSFLALENHIVENPDELEVKVSKGDFFLATANFHALLYSSEFLQYVKCLFNVSTFTSAQRSAAVDISKKVYFKFLAELFRISSEACRQEVVTFDVEEMPDAGKAKVRHVGGWAIRKVLEKLRRFVRSNIHTENVETMRSVRRHHAICELIEESLVGSLSVLEQASQHKETLQVTEARQYRERGLIHIEDAAYRFFMALESQRVQLLNDQAMRQDRANMVQVAYQKLKSNAELKSKWEQCFTNEEIKEKEVSDNNSDDDR